MGLQHSYFGIHSKRYGLDCRSLNGYFGSSNFGCRSLPQQLFFRLPLRRQMHAIITSLHYSVSRKKLVLKLILLMKAFFMLQDTFINSWLSRCCTANESSVQVVTCGPSKVGSRKFCFIHYNSIIPTLHICFLFNLKIIKVYSLLVIYKSRDYSINMSGGVKIF